MVELDVDASVTERLDDARLVRDLERMLASLDLDQPLLSVVLCDDARISELNASWRQKDGPTDVLSFPQQEYPVTGGILGDLVVSLDTAARQAEELGHDLEVEVRVLCAHGLSHLMGHTHNGDEDREVMQAAEVQLLNAIGSSGVGLIERVSR
ncbi:MAG: rRNA maturation RNase YbeY [Myxococcota bacterium]